MNITTLTNKGFSARFFALLTVASLVMTVLPVAYLNASASEDGTQESASTLASVSPTAGPVVLSNVGTFKLTVDADDEVNNLRELEIDHSMEGSLPEFSVYASEENPYGDDASRDQFIAQGVLVTYDPVAQEWTIDFGKAISDAFVANGGITFYLVLIDDAGNELGSMSPTTADNTFVYTLSRAAVAAPVDEVVEEEPRSSGGGGSSSGTRIRDRVEPTPLVLGVVDSSLPTDEELTGVLTSVSGILVAIQSGNEAGDISDEDAEKLVAQLSEILSILLRLY